MTANMAFGVRQVRDFLKKNGCVLTVRGYDYPTRSATVPELDGIRIKRKTVCEIKRIDDLNGFVALSGFGTVAEWWVQIRRFCRGRMWLYRVQIDDNELDKIERDAEKIEQNRLKNIFNAADREFAEEHPMDIRGIDSDPALVDLQPHKDAVHEARIQREAQQAERRRERMRERAREQQGEITRTIPTEKKLDVLMITGNRTLKNPEEIERRLRYLIDSRKPDIAISGMAIGADQLFVEICIEKGISVHAYIPFSGQENRWSASAQKRYRELLQRCEKKIIVCDHPSKNAFFVRNAAMVAAANRAIAVWDGQPGGTSHTVRLCNRESVPCTVIENRTGA